jgi:hypothetical protein
VNAGGLDPLKNCRIFPIKASEKTNMKGNNVNDKIINAGHFSNFACAHAPLSGLPSLLVAPARKERRKKIKNITAPRITANITICPKGLSNDQLIFIFPVLGSHSG